jgi:uncharacterized protein (DUF305 family)
MRTRMLLATGLVGLAGLAGAACSSDDDSTISSADTEAIGDHNDADVSFAKDMIPHHRQAVDMAELAADRAEDPRVLDLASRIQGAQDPEIEEMTAWLEDWDEEAPSAGEGHESMSGMSGMMSAEDMGALSAASGADFDEMFLTMMIAHHEGAVEMATVEIADGEFPEAIALAERIISAQRAEITEMNAILADGSASSGATSSTMRMDG